MSLACNKRHVKVYGFPYGRRQNKAILYATQTCQLRMINNEIFFPLQDLDCAVGFTKLFTLVTFKIHSTLFYFEAVPSLLNCS